jgi:LDH2 family malate/lactate/ureidoglycolate dehydrogenase
MERYPAQQLQQLASALFVAQGLDPQRANIVARGFLEADLLGFSTHGLARVSSNLKWLAERVTRNAGEPVVLMEAPAAASWDAQLLPGPYVMHLAVQHAAQRASQMGVYVLTLQRAQHIACLASYLVPIVEQGLLGIIMASTPDERYVSPYQGVTRLFSNNPIAFCAPSSGTPLLFDISTAITAGGQVARALREGKRLPEACLKDAHGSLSDDPEVMKEGGSVMPLGGATHGHKGHALMLMTEVLTQALAGYGRSRASGDGEANSVFLQIMDPRLLSSPADYLLEIDFMMDLIRSSEPDPGVERVRVPGERAWQARQQRLRDGVDLYPGVLDSLLKEARRLDVATDFLRPC